MLVIGKNNKKNNEALIFINVLSILKIILLEKIPKAYCK